MKSAMHYKYVFRIMEVLFGSDWGYVIAIANEMVDRMVPGRVPAEGPGSTAPLITQSYEYSWWHRRKLADIHSEVWIKFHFGGPKEFFKKGSVCTKGAMLDAVVEHIIELLERPRTNVVCPEVYMALGILLHIFMDSYAHEGFSGWRNPINSENNWYELFVPDLGHAEYGDKPDMVGCKWKRRGVVVDNSVRFMEMHNTLVGAIAHKLNVEQLVKLEAIGEILKNATSDKDLEKKLGKISNYIDFVNDDLDNWFFAARNIG